MAIDWSTSLFFDASVLVAGAHSPSGGSALLLAACQAGGFRAQMTSAVLLESYHALVRNFPRQSLQQFRQLLADINWEFLPLPSDDLLQHHEQYIHPKDSHVLAAAVEGQSQFLLTLDRQHILAASEAVKAAGLPITILRPGDFIRHYYPQHADYPHLPTTRNSKRHR